MGQALVVDGAAPLVALLDRMAQAGAPAQIVMIDGALTMPGATPTVNWRDVRLRTSAGTIALKREGDSVSVVVFGNADAGTLAMQATIARLLAP